MAGRDDDELRRRTTGLYQRCTKYGLKLLDHSWELAMTGPLVAFRDKVAHASKDQVEGMFFTALGLASAININRDNLAMVADLPRARMMFERIVALDETFYNASAHTALGLMYAARGTDVGGDPTKGREHFDRAI